MSNETGFASISKVEDVSPSGIVTVASTVITPIFEDARFTTVPPTGAGASNVTVPMTPKPPGRRT